MRKKKTQKTICGIALNIFVIHCYQGWRLDGTQGMVFKHGQMMTTKYVIMPKIYNIFNITFFIIWCAIETISICFIVLKISAS